MPKRSALSRQHLDSDVIEREQFERLKVRSLFAILSNVSKEGALQRGWLYARTKMGTFAQDYVAIKRSLGLQLICAQ